MAAKKAATNQSTESSQVDAPEPDLDEVPPTREEARAMFLERPNLTMVKTDEGELSRGDVLR